MPWAKFSDDVLSHPKLLKAGEDAANLHLRATIYCARYLTDGRVEPEMLPAITRRGDAEELAAKLVKAEAWDAHPDGGWTIRDFLRDQPSAEEVAARRAALSVKRSEAGRLGGVRSGVVRSNGANRKQLASEATKQTGSKDEASREATVEAPSRPVPTKSEPPPTPSAPGGTETVARTSEGGGEEVRPVGPIGGAPTAAVAAPVRAAEAPVVAPVPVAPPAPLPSPVAPGGSGGVAAPSETPRVDAMVSAGGVVRPNLHAAADLEVQLAKRGVTPELAAAWGKALATPEGILASWPWATKMAPKGPVSVAWLKSADMTRGEDPWDRLGNGFAAWRSLHDREALAQRRRAEERAKAPARPPPRKIEPLSPEILAKLREDFPTLKLAEAVGGSASS